MAAYPPPKFPLEDRHVDQGRPLRVAVIGAGLSGVLAGILLTAKVPEIQLTIFEKNSGVGGTWFENVYPGVRCDVPAHVYQATFDSNTEWTEQFAQGAEIRDYWKGLSEKYNLERCLQLSQQVTGLTWDEHAAIWKVNVQNVSTGETVEHGFDFVLNAIGRFNAWRMPNYPGMQDFKGTLRHASHYDPSFDASDKKVAIIGNGASGIQLVANLQSRVKNLDHYARNKTWVSASFAGDATSIKPIPLSADLQATFSDPQKYIDFRKGEENKYWRGFSGWLKNSDESLQARQDYTRLMEARLAKKPELLQDLVPDFSPHCRRLTPGPGYLEALTEDNVEYIRTPIARFTETGIQTRDGKHRPVDAVFCATGANVDQVPPYPIKAFGKELSQLWSQDGEYGFPYTYLGLAIPGFPNFGVILGPSSSGRSGTIPQAVETQVTYFAKLLRKISRQGIRSVQPSKRAADDFLDYCDSFFNTTTLSENCSSWYNGGKPGGRIHGIWPGSAAHMSTVHRDPRWEDWEYEYLSATGNRFAWYFGQGSTAKELDETSDITAYLRLPEQTDLRSVHEQWWSIP